MAKFYAYGLMALSVRWEVSEPHWKHQILNGSLEIPVIIPIIVIIAITAIIIILAIRGTCLTCTRDIKY